MKTRLQVALDGPAGTGKSTLARILAQRHSLFHLDTGAMYRSAALAADRAKIRLEEGPALEQLLTGLRIDQRPGPEGNIILMNGEDVSRAIRTPEITQHSSRIAALPMVRRWMVARQQALAESRGRVVLEGRDIGTVVLPRAEVKVYLTATDEVRAQRRLEELQAKGTRATFEAVLAEQRQRDARDQGREDSPLRPAEDAVQVDTSHATLEALAVQIGSMIERVDRPV